MLVRDGERWAVESYRLHRVDDPSPGDVGVIAYVELLQQQVEAQLGVAFDEVVAQVREPMGRAAADPSVGNLVTDAFREAAGTDMAFTGTGTLRSDIAAGPLQLSDLFLVTPLGIGTTDDRPGYALMKLTVTGSDLKDLCEFLLVGYQLRGDGYYPRVSGGRVHYNPWRVPPDRVVDVELEGGMAQLDDDATYTVALSSYVASFIPEVASLTKGLLDVQPVAIEPELKTYEALVAYVRAHPDLPVDTDERLIETHAGLFRNATWKQWTPVGLLGLLVSRPGGSSDDASNTRRGGEMAKTAPTDASVEDHLAAIAEPRQSDCRAVAQLMTEVTGEEPVMWGPSIVGFGAYDYTYASGRIGSWPATGFANRKGTITLYIMGGFEPFQELLGRLGKHKAGKSCLYIRKLSDIDVDVLRELVTGSVARLRESYPESV
ncbi:MAG: hypothetical protein GY913_30660 [Proteobacteria bacterium]|nr:hypothetical protein [Pseudomonadota bacterium]MCP4921279.1 hypothetical protein [Pseudomonadota bacterium]